MNARFMRVIFLGVFSILLTTANAQRGDDPNGTNANGTGSNVTESGNIETPIPRDNFYDRYIYEEKRIIEYDYIHEKDVFWEKRIWRVIDVREKMNHPFQDQNRDKADAFISIILDAAREGNIQLYNGAHDDFSMPMTKQDMETIGSSVDTIITFDPETFEEITEVVVNEIDPNDVEQYRLKEVWFFDEETSQLEVRILGIAPLIKKYDDNGNFLFVMPMFWAYYPELRSVLARREAFNAQNDAMRMTWEDVFEARLFSSYIYKESNVYDRRIQDYKSGTDILLESEDIKNGMFHFEHDLWEY